MIKCILITQDKREIPVFVRRRQYERLTTKLERMTFWQKLGWLFRK